MKKILILIFFLFPSLSSAAVLPAFGGNVILSIPCTCTPIPTYHIIFGLPFYNPAPVQIGALNYSPVLSPPVVAGSVGGPATYSFFNIGIPPGTKDIGDYVPGVQSCFMWTPGTPPYCELAGTGAWSWMLMSQGLIYRVGSSLVPSASI